MTCVDADEVLIERSRSGDEDAIKELVGRHLGTAYRIAYRLIGHRAEAEDIAQDVLMRMLSYRQGWFSHASFRAWLRRAIINRVLDRQRRNRSFAFSELREGLPDISEGGALEDVFVASEIEKRVSAAILMLPLRQRVAITLCFYESMSLRDAANSLGTTPGAVESLLHRAKEALRSTLSDIAIKES